MKKNIIIRALGDPRVVRVLARAVRDQSIENKFRRMRRRGMPAEEAIGRLAENHFLSDETIRTIIYKKRNRKTVTDPFDGFLSHSRRVD